MRRAILLATVFATPALAQVSNPTVGAVSQAQVDAVVAAATTGVVKTVNAASPNGAGAVTLSIPSQYTDAQAVAAAQAGITSFTNPNIAMPNGANVAHTIYQGRGSLTISGTAEQSAFPATGDGNQTIQPVAMFVGARFHFYFGGRGQTGLANVSTFTGRIKFGSTTVVSGTTIALPISTSAVPFTADVVCTILSVGVSGTVSCKGSLGYSVGLSSGALLATDLTTTTPVSINTSVAQKLDATGQLSSVIGSPSMTIYDAYIIQEN